MKKATNIVAFSLTLICCCVLASVITTNLVNKNNTVYVPADNAPYTTLSQASMPTAGKMQPVDLTEAAEKTVHGVVHIKCRI